VFNVSRGLNTMDEIEIAWEYRQGQKGRRNSGRPEKKLRAMHTYIKQKIATNNACFNVDLKNSNRIIEKHSGIFACANSCNKLVSNRSRWTMNVHIILLWKRTTAAVAHLLKRQGAMHPSCAFGVPEGKDSGRCTTHWVICRTLHCERFYHNRLEASVSCHQLSYNNNKKRNVIISTQFYLHDSYFKLVGHMVDDLNSLLNRVSKLFHPRGT